MVCFASGYALYGLFRHWHYGSGTFDMAIFDQVVWHLSRFETPSSTLRGLHNLLGDHFFPVIVLFAPLYWVAPGPEALVVAQAVLLAISIVPVFLFARSRLPRGPALCIAVAYGCFWGIQRAAAFDVHEAAFAPLAIACAILATDRHNWRLFWLSAAAMIVIKEDLIPLLGAFGIYLALQGEARRGAIAIAVSLAALVLCVGVAIPYFNDSGVYEYGGAYGNVLSRPWLLPLMLVSPTTKVATLLLWFAPFAFASLASPISMLVVPFALTRFLSASPNHWGTVFHYSAPLAPIVAMAAADGLARIAGRLQRAGRERAAARVLAGVAALGVLLSAFIPGRQPLWRVFAPAHYRSTDTQAMGDFVIALVPPDASVVAQNAIVPHLSMRTNMYLLNATAPDADYVVMSERLDPWPLKSIEDVTALVNARRAQGYGVVFEKDGWTVLHR